MSGHGHVIPNPDGSKARCGGPALCSTCAKELAVVAESTCRQGCAGRPDKCDRCQADADRIALLEAQVADLRAARTVPRNDVEDAIGTALAATFPQGAWADAYTVVDEFERRGWKVVRGG